MKIKFNRHYFLWVVLLLLCEVLIAAFARDQFIRPYLGDVLIVMFVYCAIKAFLVTDIQRTAFGVLIFAFLVETAQYFHILNVLGWQDSKVAPLLMGNAFEWTDLGCYVVGIGLVILVEQYRVKFVS